MIAAPRTEILRDSHGQVMGLHFAAANRPEHHEGIEALKAALGVRVPSEGGPSARHRLMRLPEHALAYHEFSHADRGKVRERVLHALLSVDAAGRPDRFFRHDQVLGFIQGHDLDRMQANRRGETAGIRASWNASSFAVLARDEMAIEALRDIYSAMQQRDLAIGWGAALTGTPGLTLVIISRATPQLRKAFRQVPADTRPEGVPTIHAGYGAPAA